MTQRRRIVLVVLLVVVAVPLLAALGAGWYLGTGGLAREVEQAWARRGLPARLEVGELRLTGLGEAVAERVRIVVPGRPPLCEAPRVTARFRMLGTRLDLTSLRFDAPRGGLDEERYRLLQAIIAAEAARPPSGEPTPLAIEIADGAVELPGGLALTEVTVRIDALGAEARAEGSARLAGRPLRVAVTTQRLRAGAPVVTTVEVREGAVDPRAGVAVAAGLGLVPPLPAPAASWLPALVDAAGTRLEHTAVADTWAGSIAAAWAGGSASARLDADRRRIRLDALAVQDARLGAMQGALACDRDGSGVAVEAAMWRAGPGLPLPSGLPLADIARLLPQLQLRWPVADRRLALSLSGPGRARLEVQFGGGQPPRVAASELPLVMVQGLVPAPLVLGGGQVVAASAVLAEGRTEISATLSQARLLANGWSFGPLDGRFALVAVPGRGVQVSAELPVGVAVPRPGGVGEVARPPEAQVRRVAFSGPGPSGAITINCPAVEGLLARLNGPGQLPDLDGDLDLKAEYAIGEDGTVTVRVASLGLAGSGLRLRGLDFMRGLALRLSGSARLSADGLDLDLGGHLRGGELRIADSWLPIAALTPLFSFDATARLAGGRFAGLAVRRIMVRAADLAGEPRPGGYSAQLEGTLSAEVTGAISGVVDHADLAALLAFTPLRDVAVTGEAAVALDARFEAGRLLRVAGSFLPLGADLGIDQARFRVQGVTGRVMFAVGSGEPR